MRGSGRRLGQFAFCAGIVLVGCGQLVGLDDLEVRDDVDAAPEESLAELPALPALPDPEHVDTCEACVEANCDVERRACEASELCREVLRCTGTCDDPACLAECTNRFPRSYAFQDYFACAFESDGYFAARTSACVEECNVGENWACTGAYTWSSLDPSRVVLVDALLQNAGAMAAGALATLPGVEVAGCAPRPEFIDGSLNCGDDWKDIDGYGLASGVTVTGIRNVIGVRGAGERLLVFPGGITGPGRLDLPVVSAIVGLGNVMFFAADCLGSLASVRAEISDTPSDAGVMSSNAQRYYFNGRSLDSVSEVGRAGVFYTVRPGPDVRVWALNSSGETVTERTVWVDPSWLTIVHLYPLDASAR